MSWLHDSKLTLDKSVGVCVPVRVDGLGCVEIKDHVNLGFRKAPLIGTGEILLQARTREAVISIGPGTITSNNISIVSVKRIAIGDGCQIGDLVTILDADFHEINPETRNKSEGISNPVEIGSNVWLGSRVMVLKGVSIGDNSVIAAGSVVSKSIPANVIAGGIPARVMRSI